MNATKSADPYLALLDVRDLRRPPNAYQILGLKDRASEMEVIEKAARRRRNTLMSRKDKATPIQWQQMLDALEGAIQTLTDAEKKAQYDQQLEKDSAPDSNGVAPRHDAQQALLALQSTVCTQCGAANVGGRKFCGSCGTPFHEPCIECRGQTLVNEPFCGNCGVNLEEACRERRKFAEVELRRAQELRDEARYQEALGIVRPLAELEMNRLAGIAQAARQLQESITELRNHSKSRVAGEFQRARDAVDQYRWDDAVQAIEAIPPLLRTREHKALLQTAAEAREELKLLQQTIQAALKAERFIGLLPKVERAMVLDPNNERLKTLLVQLRKRQWQHTRQEAIRLQEQARQLIGEFKYQAAYDLLESAPSEVADEDFQQLMMHARELAFLWQTLRQSPLAGPNLLEIGQRLQKLSPEDPQLGAILAQLKQRLAKNSVACAVVPWAKPPAETALGWPVERLTTFGQIDISEIAAQPNFSRGPSRLYAACGAALQGLGKAVINTNLLPKTGKGLLGIFNRRPRPCSSAWGIDISGSGLKAIRLMHDAKSGKVAATAFDLIEYGAELGSTDSEAVRRDALAASLDRFLERNNIKGEPICLTMSGAQVLGRFFALPPVETKRLGDMMQYEARQQVPFPLEQLEWDYHIYYGDGAGAQVPRDALLLATKRQRVKQHLDLFNERKIRVHLLQSDGVALHNFYQAAFASPTGAKQPRVALLDVGADNTNFVISGHDGIWFRSLPRGSNDLTKALMRRFEVNFATAEQLKLRPAKSKRISSLHDAWEPVFEQLLKDVQDSMNAYQAAHPQQPVAKLLGCGGGFSTLGLHRHLLGA